MDYKKCPHGTRVLPPPVNPPAAVTPPDTGHQPGGLPMISDSAFSLVTLIYVSIAFVFVFFMFCWRTTTTTNNGPTKNGDGSGKKTVPSCPLMTFPENGQTKCQNGGKVIINTGPTPNHLSSDCPTILRLAFWSSS